MWARRATANMRDDKIYYSNKLEAGKLARIHETARHPGGQDGRDPSRAGLCCGLDMYARPCMHKLLMHSGVAHRSAQHACVHGRPCPEDDEDLHCLPGPPPRVSLSPRVLTSKRKRRLVPFPYFPSLRPALSVAL